MKKTLFFALLFSIAGICTAQNLAPKGTSANNPNTFKIPLQDGRHSTVQIDSVEGIEPLTDVISSLSTATLTTIATETEVGTTLKTYAFIEGPARTTITRSAEKTEICSTVTISGRTLTWKWDSNPVSFPSGRWYTADGTNPIELSKADRLMYDSMIQDQLIGIVAKFIGGN